MITIGYTNKGERLEFDCIDGNLYCYHKDLISLEVPEGVKFLWCENNSLTKLVIPEGVIKIYCWNNLLSELAIPNSVEYLYCDRNVLGLDKIDWNCHIRLY